MVLEWQAGHVQSLGGGRGSISRRLGPGHLGSGSEVGGSPSRTNLHAGQPPELELLSADSWQVPKVHMGRAEQSCVA